MAWDDDTPASSAPPPGERRWVHPSELHSPVPPTQPAPTKRRRTNRRTRLPIGTALVATATGAVAMFAAINALGLMTASTGSVRSTGRPQATTTVSGVSSTAGLAVARSIDDATRVTVTAGGERRDGVIVAADSVLVAWSDDLTNSALTVISDDGSTWEATSWTRVPGELARLTVPGLLGRYVTVAPSDDLDLAEPVFTDDHAGVRQAGTVASISTWNAATSTCRPMVFGMGLTPGAALWDRDQAFIGFIAIDDPDPEDALVPVLTLPDVAPSGSDRAQCGSGASR